MVAEAVDISEFLSEPPRCVIGMLELSDEQWRKVNTALHYPKEEIPNTKIAKVLSDWGFVVKPTSLSQHRRGVCCCA